MEQIPIYRYCRDNMKDDNLDSDEEQELEFMLERGSSSTKIITLNSRMIDLDFEFTEDAKVHLSIEEKNLNLHSESGKIKILWINASQTINEPHIDFKSYVESKLNEEEPEIFILSSSSQSYPGHAIATDLKHSGPWRANHYGKVGMDGSCFCVATKGGVIAGRVNVVNSRMVFTYAHSI